MTSFGISDRLDTNSDNPGFLFSDHRTNQCKLANAPFVASLVKGVGIVQQG